MLNKIVKGLLAAFALLCMILGGAALWQQKARTALAICRPNCQNIDLGGVNSGGNLNGISLGEIDLAEIDLRGANLRGAQLSESTSIDPNLRLVWKIVNEGGAGRDLRGANLAAANLSEANLNKADLRGADLSNADLSNADLSGADLRGSDLRGVKLNDKTKIDSKWRLVWEIVTTGGAGRDLQGVDLSEANLSGINLHQANLSKANLMRVNLSQANLGEVTLREANLTGADLGAADLSGADLTAANLCAAEFDDNPRLNERFYLIGKCGGEVHMPVSSCEEAEERDLLGDTFLCMNSKGGYPTAQGGKGNVWIVVPQGNNFLVRHTLRGYNDITTEVQGGDGWQLVLRSSEEVAVGTYQGTSSPPDFKIISRTRVKGYDENWLDRDIECDPSAWRFRILELVHDSEKNVKSFAADFEGSCGGAMDLSGYIRFHSAIGLQ